VGRLGLLGGTFDPVHYGHLDAADAARRALGLDEVLFVPSHVPPHRATRPLASAFHRFALVALAIDGCRGYRVSDDELRREGPTYTIDTLRALHRRGVQPSQIFFIMGADACAEIATWREFPAVLDAANFVVVARPGASLERALAPAPEVLARVQRPTDASDLARKTAVFPLEATTRDVSATEVRTRIAARRAIDDLVPAAVARYIEVHHLYEEAGALHE
jgi:nicotinate-nucleotide adenylyltransferase